MNAFKKFCNYSLILFGATIISTSAFAATPPTAPAMYINDSAVAFTAQAPFISDDQHTMIPFRQVGEILDIQLQWQAPYVLATGTHQVTGKALTVRIEPGASVMMVNHTAQFVNTPSVIKDGSTYIPLRLFAETFGYEVNWDDSKIHIVTPEPLAAPTESSVVVHIPEKVNSPKDDNHSSSDNNTNEDNSNNSDDSSSDESGSGSTSNPTPPVDEPTPPVVVPPVEEPTPPVEEPAPPVVVPPVEEPVPPVVKPEPPVVKPEPPVVKPEPPVVKPEPPVVEPEPPVVKPEPPTETPSVQRFEQEVVDLVNEERTSRGLKPLTLDAELSDVAREKSKDMKINNYFDHNSPTYGSPFEMMQQFGIRYSRAAENIAYGYSTPQKVMDGWMNSSGHRKNILDPNLTHIGVGYYSPGHYWTQMFKTP